MRWTIIGTAPYEDFPLIESDCFLDRGRLRIGSHCIDVARGTPALIATACIAAQALGISPPRTLIVGDIGDGRGSEKLYARLLDQIVPDMADLLIFHYLQPDVNWSLRISMRLEELPKRPVLVADAGYMYVAKMSGMAAVYDLFTPDIGELAFLADEKAPHPFYTRGFLLQDEAKAPELVKRAYENENASRYLLVKGRKDLVASEKGILDEIVEPCVEHMEPIGGTGDSLTGLVSSLIASGMPVEAAASAAARSNRYMGLYANPTPAHSISDLLVYLPEALKTALEHKNQT